jgi:hypothetical protein
VIGEVGAGGRLGPGSNRGHQARVASGLRIGIGDRRNARTISPPDRGEGRRRWVFVRWPLHGNSLPIKANPLDSGIEPARIFCYGESPPKSPGLGRDGAGSPETGSNQPEKRHGGALAPRWPPRRPALASTIHQSPGTTASRLEPRQQSRWSHAAIEPFVGNWFPIEPWPNSRRRDRGTRKAARSQGGPRLPGDTGVAIMATWGSSSPRRSPYAIMAKANVIITFPEVDLR